MPESWTTVAAEVAAAIADVGLAMTLRKPPLTGPATPFDTTPVGSPRDFTIYAVPDSERVRDTGGTLIGVTRETLMVSAIGVVPEKADQVLVQGTWREVESVERLWHGGIDLLYTLGLVK